MNTIKALYHVLFYKVTWCINKTGSWKMGSVCWDTVTYHYAHLGRLTLCLDDSDLK